MKEHPEDICHCGDYRKNHPDNGACDLNGLGHGTVPDSKCAQFRLVLLHDEYLELCGDAGRERDE